VKIMSNHKEDLEYMQIVESILENENFNKIKKYEHHGVTRFEHSLKVSYYSYIVAKKLRLNYREVARGGLLHDFFYSPNERTKKERIISTFVHPKKAVATATENFNLTDKEKDMIRAHMFPIGLSIPKYMESWIVSLVDKTVAVGEVMTLVRSKMSFAYNMSAILLFNVIK
jgi:uncharacterized protein